MCQYSIPLGGNPQKNPEKTNKKTTALPAEVGGDGHRFRFYSQLAWLSKDVPQLSNSVKWVERYVARNSHPRPLGKRKEMVWGHFTAAQT